MVRPIAAGVSHEGAASMELFTRFVARASAATLVALAGVACGTDGGADSGSTGGATSTGGISSGGGAGSGGASSGGTSSGDGGTSSGGSNSTGGQASGGSDTGGGSASGGAGSGGEPGSCTAWSTADPAAPGPFEVVTEPNVGPLAGVGEDDQPTDFMVFRPAELGADGHCHPIVTWGNGTGSTPDLYGTLLEHLASHGFIVIGSNSPNVAQGDPPPMVVGVEWLIEQNGDPESPYYGHVDVDQVGATGHSQGGLATSTAGRNSLVKTIAPLCGSAGPGDDLSGPGFFFCGGLDDVATCENIHNAFSSVTGQPAMFANYLTADHANWITFFGDTVSPAEAAVTAWMRVHLMGDAALRSWFYGASCLLCDDPDWEVEQSMMDE